MHQKSSKVSLETFVGHFAFARSVLWLLGSTMLLNYFSSEILNDKVLKYFSAGYQFYVLFVIYAFVQLMEGLKCVRVI